MASKLYGGLVFNFVDKELEKFICCICHLVSQDPHLTKCCGQHFCESCLNNWFAKKKTKSCPHCRAEGKEFQHFLDKKLKREIDSLRIYCTNKEEGCEWAGELKYLKDHLELANGCGYVEVECPNKCIAPVSIEHMRVSLESETSRRHVKLEVIKRMKRKELKNHLKKECYLRPYRCEHCGHKDTYYRITGKHPNKSERSKSHHYTECSEFLVECPNKCGSNLMKRKNVKDHCNRCPQEPLHCPNKCGRKDVKRKYMEYHHSQCPQEPVQCPFEEAGCKEKLVRCELEQHTSDNQQQHLLMVMGAYKEMKKENEEMKREKMREYKEIKYRYKEMKRENSHIKDTIEHTKDELYELKRRMDRKRKRADNEID